MRVTVPAIPNSALLASNAKAVISLLEATDRVATFLTPGNVVVLTGAGVSVDSGIRAYRGKDGRYMNPNYKPIFYQELVDDTEKGHAFRQRYWLRSYLGYPPVRNAQPNPTHYALAALQYTSYITKLITQNVDGLHHKAIKHIWDDDKIEKGILELHGKLRKVRCKYGHFVDRETFQEWLSAANPRWAAFTAEMEASGTELRTNPDGDVELEGASYTDFVLPDCPTCLSEKRRNSVHKPEVVFFGESIPGEIKDVSLASIKNSDRLFVIGTTLATYSAFRLLKLAVKLRKPVMILNVGPTRADSIEGIEKIELSSGSIIREVVKAILGPEVSKVPVVSELLRSGVTNPPSGADNERT